MNGIRCVAILIIVLHHFERAKFRLGLDNVYPFFAERGLGAMALNSFFILSGFVISYLLFSEKRKTKTIAVRKFYIRRILRIVPLYLLLVGFVFAFLPSMPGFFPEALEGFITVNYWEKLTLFLLFLPQLSKVLYGFVPPISHLWSIGIEEQFYAVWPWIIKLKRNFLTMMVGILVFYYCALAFFYQDGSDVTLTGYASLFELLLLSRVDMFIFGGITAYIYFKQWTKLLAALYHPVVQAFAYIGLAVILLFNFRIPVVHAILMALFSCYFILNITTNPKTFLKLETSWLRYCGRISYGIYLFHPLIILCVLYGFDRFGMQNGSEFQFAAPVLVLLFTFAVSALSYIYFESIFLRIKGRFSIIKSGAPAKLAE
jgi:peptidoglycan/LPS O-acetylase OafA/YrhL